MNFQRAFIHKFLRAAGLLMLAASTWVNAEEEQRIAALINSQQWQEAQSVISQWQPEDPNARLFMQYQLENAKDPALAIIRLQEFLLKAPDYPEAYNNLALYLIQQGEYKQASEWLQKGIATDDRYLQLHENLSKLYSLMASQAYQKALGKSASPTKTSEFSRFDYLQPRQANAGSATQTIAVTPPRQQEVSPIHQTDVVAEKQLIAELRGWADAWSSQKIVNYLAFYADSFRPADGLDLATWKQQRKERVSGPRFIKVVVSQPEVTLFADGSIASVRFIQHYRSNSFDDKIVKFMIWGLQEGKWRILQEETGV